MSEKQQTTPSAPKGKDGDRIIEYIERGQHWVSENYKLLIGIFIVSIIAVYVNESRANSAKERENQLWNQSSKLKTALEIEQFVDSNISSQAGAYMNLQLVRKHLDDGNYSKAITYAQKFIDNNPESSQLGIAILLKSYALEESGQIDQAKDGYKQAAEKSIFVAAIANKAVSRLSE